MIVPEIRARRSPDKTTGIAKPRRAENGIAVTPPSWQKVSLRCVGQHSEASSTVWVRDQISITLQLANGSGRICTLKTFGMTPLPPSLWKLARVPDVVQRPRPFQPPFGSSIRPSTFLLKNPSG